ncbi:hypothetical protein CEXT_562671 [Caerostris extrusa]|uniref:Uncharacterized protein n=1 Tax=Caerostris extrusa TaxID=172846 RepID=A0AAV4XIZ3_CAEEX|nr:hypothetical protein CEXT_562671 [Caerostris extrusa]
MSWSLQDNYDILIEAPDRYFFWSQEGIDLRDQLTPSSRIPEPWPSLIFPPPTKKDTVILSTSQEKNYYIHLWDKV